MAVDYWIEAPDDDSAYDTFRGLEVDGELPRPPMEQWEYYSEEDYPTIYSEDGETVFEY